VKYVDQAWKAAQRSREQQKAQENQTPKDVPEHGPPANRAVWWIESPSGLAGIDGPSAQASIYAAARSLVARVPLDSAVAISATLDLNQPALPLGPVAGGDRKWRLANKADCSMVLVNRQTADEARQQIPADQQASLPKLKAIETFEEAWKELTGEARIFGALRDDAEQQWLDQWSRIIDGDTVTPIQRNPKTGKLELRPP
jgi:ATP-dependent Lon protease